MREGHQGRALRLPHPPPPVQGQRRDCSQWLVGQETAQPGQVGRESGLRRPSTRTAHSPQGALHPALLKPSPPQAGSALPFLWVKGMETQGLEQTCPKSQSLEGARPLES